ELCRVLFDELEERLQELCRVLFDELEERLKGSPHQSLITDLFQGTFEPPGAR
ncbi:hypothetical protein T484DRAFT_1833518, partial [Baffinella frigidus]